MSPTIENLRNDLQAFLNLRIHTAPVPFRTIDAQDQNAYTRRLIEYAGSESDAIRAYLFVPQNREIKGGVLVHHQHNGERHYGKSEVSGLVGDSFQAFCPALAGRGIMTLAPDSICFEDRRKNKKGTEPEANNNRDFLQHYNEMCYRLLRRDLLMKKVVEDSSIAISLLHHHPLMPVDKIGILGHSYGGNTVLFHSPFDERIRYSCSSGAVCSYQHKMNNDTGIEMAEVIPGFVPRFDIEDLISCIAPRKMLVVSASEDIYSQDAAAVCQKARSEYRKLGAEGNLLHKAFEGEHALDSERFRFIIDWFVRGNK
jgi:dienelactone hydrolase